MNKYGIWSLFQSCEESVIHAFAEAYPAPFSVNTHCWYYRYINFINFQIRVSRLEDAEFLHLQGESKWYHLETVVYHKREIYFFIITSEGRDAFSDVGFHSQRFERQNGSRPFDLGIVEQFCHDFRIAVTAVVAAQRLQRFKTVFS